MEFNIEPYYDDFKENALDNNYVRILFKPGKAVQARELTQLQTILQNQIKQFGDHVFQDGSPVIGGNMTLDNKCRYIKLDKKYQGVDVEVEDFENRVIRNSSGTIQAKVLATFYPNGGEPTLMVRYITGNEFNNGDLVRVAGESTNAVLQAANSTGQGTVVSINEGVFYADGFFVKVNDQTAVVSAYSSSANVKIGLEINEEVVDSEIDSTLLDPAQSSFNYQAAGADRYQFSLALTTRPLDSTVDESKFFELMRVENGVIVKQVKYPVYAELEKTLARRTFDESGDYTVKAFRASVQDSVDSNNYIIAIEPGKAYVKGFEFETLGTYKLEVPKPRSASDVRSLIDVDVDLSYGNYLYVTSVDSSSNGFVNIAALETVDIHCVDKPNVNVLIGTAGATSNTFLYQNTKIGTARIRNMVRYSTDVFDPLLDSNGIYKLSISDINVKPKVFKVAGASSNANSLRLPEHYSPVDNAYVNVSVTVLPIALDAVAHVFVTVNKNSYNVNANASGTFASKVDIGDVILVGDQVREVVQVDVGNLVVNTAFTATFANSATNPVQIFKQTATDTVISNQTRTIIDYDGATKTAFLDRQFDNNKNAPSGTVAQLNFKIDFAESLFVGPCAANALSNVANASMNVSIVSKYTTGETSLEETEKNALIFKLPKPYAKHESLGFADYVHNKLVLNRGPETGTGDGTGNPAIFQLSQPNGLESYESIPWADSNSGVQQNLQVLVRHDSSGTYTGKILQLTAANVSISPTGNTLAINTGIATIANADIFVTVKVNNSDNRQRAKQFISNTLPVATSTSFTYPTTDIGDVQVTLPDYGVVASINTSNGYIFLTDPVTNDVRPGDAINLYVPDVVRIRKILVGNNTILPNATVFTDVTDHFYVDYGQRDDRYDHTKIILREGYNSPKGKMLVHVDYYKHVYSLVSSNISYFSADSYDFATQYDTGSIPIYTSSTGQVYYLRDCLDFRPTQILGSATGAYNVPKIPAPDEVAELSYDYYLPRIDKLVLSKDKEFRVIEGKSSPAPLPPDDVDDAMTLYTIKLPPYVADVRDINLVYRENRRFTMKDISSIEKRLQKVEFFTSLNNVERLALADKTQYEDGTEKEKYGIVGENFTNFNIADFKNADFNVALENGFMIPPMKVYTLGLKPVATNLTKVNKKTVTLNYSETPAITQGLASNKAISVQPFLFGQFHGSITLTPETDFWVSEDLKPEIISVPEKIVQKEIVIREVVIEKEDPPTCPAPSSNANTVIITNPGDDPPPSSNDVVIITPPTTPPPVLPPKPTRTRIEREGEDLKIVAPDFGVGIQVERDPWGKRPPMNYGFKFGYGGTIYSTGTMFEKGGLFNGDNNWFPTVPNKLIIDEPPGNNMFNDNIPTETTPIGLGGGFSGIGSGFGGLNSINLTGGEDRFNINLDEDNLLG